MNYGAIYGAITNPYSKEALRHAKVIYEEIRHRTTDIKSIAFNTGYSETQVAKVKNYLFTDKHYLEDGYRRFDENFEIGQSWTRLTTGEFAYHDLILLKHEIMEMEFIELGLSQREAHAIINPYANYTKLSKEFYARLSNGEKIPDIVREEREKYDYGKDEEYRSSRER